MTERKPLGMTWETWIDRQIREAQERGEFSGLAGSGKPIPDLLRPRDEAWWHKRLMQREGVATLPKTLLVRKNFEQALIDIAAADDEDTVRQIVEAINVQIREINGKASSGPPSNLMPLDVERVVRTWSAGRT